MSSPRVISLFSGVGGLDFGFRAAGFKTSLATDFDSDACESLKLNGFKNVVEKDIGAFSRGDILAASGLASGDVDVLIGGPPCQPFSKCGYWSQRKLTGLDDPRAETLESFLRILEQVRPRVFLLENVEGLTYSGKSEGIDYIRDQISAINERIGTRYRPSFQVLLAADYGVPQLRSRFFMVASADGRVFEFPDRTHFNPEKGSEGTLVPYMTCWDAIGVGLKEPDEELGLTGKWADLLPSIPEGENYLYHTDRGGGLPLFGWRRRYWSFLL